MTLLFSLFFFFFFNDTATTEIYTLSLHDALPICWILRGRDAARREPADAVGRRRPPRVLPGWSPGSDPALSRAAGRSFPPARDGGRGEGVLRSVPAPGSTVGLLSDDRPGRGGRDVRRERRLGSTTMVRA